ncbi:hypothetical protein T11_17941 [Trichinella zimbabwensis]|uniref:Uncharacterized protein n=1 Tax=Trichinella zimbabwensis TaxID=268475 RepID=A0A0V1GBJ7_9BILA|nr:hypothetical protein T11_17941 [Trichinella zimbabwensis]
MSFFMLENVNSYLNTMYRSTTSRSPKFCKP